MTSTAARSERDALILHHRALVDRLVRDARRRLPGHVSTDDLTSAGLLALVSAARSYEPDRGVPFAGFAATRIRGAILDELRGLDWASRSVRRRARTIEAARQELTGTLHRLPTTGELAERLGVPEPELALARDDDHRATVLSLEHLVEQSGHDIGTAAGEGPEEALLHRERLAVLCAAIGALPERLRLVVGLYYVKERPVAEIARTLGVSSSRVSQLRAAAVNRLRTDLKRVWDLPDGGPDEDPGTGLAPVPAAPAVLPRQRPRRTGRTARVVRFGTGPGLAPGRLAA